MSLETRREFTRHALQSLTALALIEGLSAHRLFGADVKPIVDGWFKELETISRDVHDHRVKDVEFQKSLEALYRRVDLNALVRTVLGDMQQEIGARKVEWQVDPLPAVLVDAAMLRLVFRNLLSNALKYSPAGQPVRVAVRGTETAARIAVADQGVGLAADEIPQLFQKYGRVRSQRTSQLWSRLLVTYVRSGPIDFASGVSLMPTVWQVEQRVRNSSSPFDSCGSSTGALAYEGFWCVGVPFQLDSQLPIWVASTSGFSIGDAFCHRPVVSLPIIMLRSWSIWPSTNWGGL